MQAAGMRGLRVIQAGAQRALNGLASFSLDSSLGFSRGESDP